MRVCTLLVGGKTPVKALSRPMPRSGTAKKAGTHLGDCAISVGLLPPGTPAGESPDDPDTVSCPLHGAPKAGATLFAPSVRSSRPCVPITPSEANSAPPAPTRPIKSNFLSLARASRVPGASGGGSAAAKTISGVSSPLPPSNIANLPRLLAKAPGNLSL